MWHVFHSTCATYLYIRVSPINRCSDLDRQWAQRTGRHGDWTQAAQTFGLAASQSAIPDAQGLDDQAGIAGESGLLIVGPTVTVTVMIAAFVLFVSPGSSWSSPHVLSHSAVCSAAVAAWLVYSKNVKKNVKFNIEKMQNTTSFLKFAKSKQIFPQIVILIMVWPFN